MTPCRKLRERGSPALITALIFSISICASSSSFAADERAASDAAIDFVPGSERGSMRPPATFFSINAVLAKLDRQSGRGPDAIRHASLTPNIETNGQPAPKETPAIGKEPFGLFTFRAPEGMLWRKWRGVEVKEIQGDTPIFKSGRAHFVGAALGNETKFTGAAFGDCVAFSGVTFGKN